MLCQPLSNEAAAFALAHGKTPEVAAAWINEVFGMPICSASPDSMPSAPNAAHLDIRFLPCPHSAHAAQPPLAPPTPATPQTQAAEARAPWLAAVESPPPRLHLNFDAEAFAAKVQQMDDEGFGNCTVTGSCEAACPKEISLDFIARLNREYGCALVKKGEV